MTALNTSIIKLDRLHYGTPVDRNKKNYFETAFNLFFFCIFFIVESQTKKSWGWREKSVVLLKTKNRVRATGSGVHNMLSSAEQIGNKQRRQHPKFMNKPQSSELPVEK